VLLVYDRLISTGRVVARRIGDWEIWADPA
jgi:hypothetical protein